MEHEKNKEYEYGGLTINGFAMIFFTFMLIPALLVGSLMLFMDNAPALG